MKNLRQYVVSRLALHVLTALFLLLIALFAVACDGPATVQAPTPSDVPPVGATFTPPGTAVAAAPAGVFEVYFTAPSGSRDESTYVNGPDTILAASIDQAQQTVDVAAFEMNSPAITQALLNAHGRGVQVRIVTDNDHGLDIDLYEEYLDAEDDDEREDIIDDMESPPDETTLDELYDAGIPIVDDGRSALMHDKFAIIDSTVVWTGSMNMTINGAYRNNNNLIRFRNQRMVQNYQAEFDEMFLNRRFGPTSPRNTPNPQFSIDGSPVEVYFAPEDGVVDHVVAEIQAAQQRVRFMTFSFTLDAVGQAMVERGQAGVTVEGVFETTSSLTQYSELARLYCAGFDVRQDGGPFVLHHKVILIDDAAVLIGSFNFSSNATTSNDENLVIIRNPGIVARYMAEWQARFDEGSPPEPWDITCN